MLHEPPHRFIASPNNAKSVVIPLCSGLPCVVWSSLNVDSISYPKTCGNYSVTVLFLFSFLHRVKGGKNKR